ncbi:urease accessory protein UreH domain-containing protein [Aestuariivivens sediminicola]|uniref:urease accessory protein UreH domain-containing protein n=1 Tax=Aestuariivivens sediminicola TaxID=2913560 RepID=UPI001F566709|nr:sulfite exporter TauE/SafE family protein [Aestuariivivens sediminicola]
MESLPLIAGLTVALLHVVTGPDHLAAVTPFAIESKRKAWKIGLAWGMGHIFGMLAIGLLFLIFKAFIPVDSISAYSEQLVGLTLIGIAFWVFYIVIRPKRKHEHLHVHSDANPLIHKHEHVHTHHEDHSHTHSHMLKQTKWTSFSIGVLHGFAGIAHFLMFLPALGFQTQWESVTYILGFGMGTILAMTAFAFLIGKISSFTKQGHNVLFFNSMRIGGGLFAAVVGVYWLFGLVLF